jgi:hypothetical protein
MGFFDQVLVYSSSNGGLGLNVYIAGGDASNPIPVNIISGGGSGSSGGGGTGIATSTLSIASVFSYDSSNYTTLLSGNLNRVGISIWNDSNQSLLVNFGPSASLNAWDLTLFPNQYYENPSNYFWKGQITGIGYGVGSGSIRVKEFLP